ncbi:MAG: polysaccharide biosynthesis protein [Candidatus Sericytochromatia bacterium]
MRFPLFRLAHVAVDTLLCIAVYLAVYLLRFDGQIPPGEMRAFWLGLPLLVAIRLAANYSMGLYSHLWKYFGIYELFGLIRAVGLGSIVFIGLTYLLGLTGFPRSIFVFEAAFYLLALGGVRYSRRFSSEVSLFRSGRQERRALIVGAGDAGAMMASEMLRHRDMGFVPVGFIDDNPDKWRAKLHGLRVFGGRQRLAEIVENREVDTVILAMPSVARRVIREYLELCQPLPVALRIVPTTHQILSGEARVEQLRQIQIEDLLGRDPVRLDDAQLKTSLRGQRVLVTGAGGSIGSELCRQILTYAPEHLYLLGHGENSIYQIARELADDRVTPVIADIRDPRQLEVIFRRYRPQQLFHAAAHKHVPLMERQVTEAFLNNVWGSHCLLETALAEGVSKIVLISTDKAAEPSSLMGLSKYFAELVARRFKLHTQQGLLSVVRFGNVIGSRGSVIPLFEQQIAAGGPLTITDPAMTRYFMTIPEAVQLVLQASVLQHDAGNFILDMGEPIRILDLARNMIRLSGYQADELEVRTTGMRPGEKVHETLVWTDEVLHPTACPQILAAEAAPERIQAHLALLESILAELEQRPEQFESFFEEKIRPAFAGLQSQGSLKNPATSGLP